MAEDKTKVEIDCPVCRKKKIGKVYIASDTRGFLHVMTSCPNCKNLLTYSHDLEWVVPDFELKTEETDDGKRIRGTKKSK